MNGPFKNVKTKNIVILAIVVFCLPIFVALCTVWFIVINLVIDDVTSFLDDDTDFDEITYVVPDEFEPEYGNTIITYEYDGDVGSCDMSVSESNKREDFEYWFKGNVFFSLNDEVDEIKNVNVNNNNALYTKRVTEYGTEHFYGFESINHYYLLTYTLYDPNHGDTGNEEYNPCYSALDRILSTIEIK